jgi:TolB-like protein
VNQQPDPVMDRQPERSANEPTGRRPAASARSGLLHRLRERGVIRVAASYAVIAWLALQIASVVLEPLGLPKWVMTALIIAAAVGFPIALALAWFLEIGEHGIERDTAPAGVPRPTVRGLRHYADAIVIGVLLIAVVVLLVRQSDLGKPKPPDNPAIAVLPFENLSGDPEQEYFSDGLAEEMLDRLGRVPGLKVIARSSSFGFKGQDLDAKAIAGKLGVTTVLEGSVRRSGQRLKLTARLIDGATGAQTWSGSFDREMTDIFDVQAELAAAIVDAIIPAARGETVEHAPPPTTDLDAYDLYLAARAQLVLRTASSMDKSVELSEQVVRLDPGFARGQAQLANSLLFQAMYSGREPTSPEMATLLRRAETAIHEALAIDPDLSEAHGAYANLLRTTGRPGAEEQYRRALELNPSNAATWHDYAVYLGNVEHRHEESDRATERALELDPRQPTTWANYLGRFAGPNDPRYRQEFERALRMVGDMPFAIDRFTLPTLSTAGFPIQVMEAALVKQREPSAENVPLWINRFRAWLAVDPERAMQSLPQVATEKRHGLDQEAVRLFLDADVSGLRGDWERFDRDLAQLDSRQWSDPTRVSSMRAFWYEVQGRHAEAAEALALAGPIPDDWIPPAMGVDANYGLMDTAKVRILRATGRGDEARRYAEDLLTRLRAERTAVGPGCIKDGRRYDGWMRHASLAAGEGLKDEAVDAIEAALRCGDLPPAFQPQLPWFRELEGYAPYDALLDERARRVERTRGELLRLEAQLAQSTPAPR